MRTTNEMITEAKFWQASGIESHDEIFALLELGEHALSTTEKDFISLALDMHEIESQDKTVAQLISSAHRFDWDNYVYDNTVGLEENE